VGNFIYHFRHNTAGFYRYSISGNSWGTLSDYPGGLMGDGVDAVYDGSDTFYVQRGNGNGSFAKYTISQNSWSVLTTSTISVSTGGSLHYYPGEDYIYSFGGNSGTSFARYSISGNSWSTLTSVPNTVTVGTAVVRQGNSDYIYVLRGSNTGSFYRYSISGNSWTTLTSVPQNATLGSSLLSSDTGEIYALLGGNAYFFRYTTSRTTYSTPGTYTSPVFDTTGHTGFTTLSYTSSTPGNTTLTIDARAGDTATPDGSWTSWQTGISNGGDISALGTRRYIQYRANLSTSNTARTPELADLTLQYGRYTSGSLISSPYNANDASNVVGSISWSESETPGTSVTFQVRTSPNNATWTDWTGPDGTSATVFTDSTGAQDMPAAFNDSENDQWMQYRMTLTGNGSAAPTVSDTTLTYVVNAPPDIAIVTSTPMVQSSAGVVALSYLVRDIDTAVGVTPGMVDIDLQYCTSNCGSVGNEVWETAASSSLTGTYGEAISIQAEDYTEYSLIWDPTISLPGHYNGTDFKIRLRANDSEAANNYGYDESNIFTLDTTDPVVLVSIDGRNDAPYNLTLAVTDDTTDGLEMRLSNNNDLSPDGLNPGSGTWVSYLTTSTWDFPLGGTTVYYQVRDAYGNVSADGAVSQAQTPEVPDSIVYRDVSNSETEEWREFIAWGVVPLPGPGFDEYTLWRSTDGGVTYTELTTQADRLINYYIDDNLSNETTYYYRVSVTDSDGNISNYSSVASDRPDGQGGSDETVPTISNVTSTALGTDTVTITWDTDELSDSTVDYMTDTGGDFSNAESIGLTAMVDSAGGLGQHTVTLSGLTPATTYYYRVRSEDPQSNEGVSTEDPDGYTFTTLAGPSLTDVAVSRISNTDATITWTTDQSSDSYVYYSTSTDFSSPTLVGLANNTFEHEITLGSLSLGTTYYFYVQSGVGVAKNVVLGEIQYYTFTTTNDVTAPVLTFDSETDVTVSDESISLSWVTDEIATSTVEYGTSNEYGTTVINANLNTNHSFTLNNLLRVRSTISVSEVRMHTAIARVPLNSLLLPSILQIMSHRSSRM
jgi:hypothetical protein